MVRTQIQLTEEQARALKEIAAERGVSMAELIRQSVDELLAKRQRDQDWQRVLEVIGRYRSGHSDIARRHDDYLAEDFR